MANVLIVEDERMVSSLLRTWLAGEHTCHEARSIADARQSLEGGDVDLIVLDHQLPDGLGLDLLGELRSRDVRFPPVLLVTGHGNIHLASRAVDLGICGICPKPLDRSSFLLRLQACLDGRRLMTLQSSGRLRRLESYIELNLRHGPRLADVLRHLGMSQSAFHRWLRAARGQSYIRLLSEVRLRVARQLLAETDASIREVAEKTGFGDQGYFARWFRRTTGISPREERRSGVRGRGTP